MFKIRIKKQMHTPRGQEWLDLDLEFVQGNFIALFGASGAGKTTFLRVLAGLIEPQEGFIEIDGEVWLDTKKNIKLQIQHRRIGFVSQENTLFPNMTLRENIAYACLQEQERGSIDEWIGIMGLRGLEDRKPDALSGGQKQRASLIRALINRPKVLLLDEPLSNLDVQARLNLQDEIIRLYQKTGISTIMVTHDLSEVFRMSQQVFVIEQGRLIKSGSPQEVFVNHELSGKFKFTGQVIEIIKDGVVNVVTLSIGNNITRVVATDEELKGLSVGCSVVVASKAFNPLILLRH